MPLGQFEKAIKDLTTATELDRSNFENYRERAECYVALKDYDHARADWSKALELKPDSALELNNLAWFLATCADVRFRDPARAVELAGKAVHLAPKAGMCWNTLGSAHYRRGNWKEAISALEKSVELRSGGDAFDWFFLAMARHKLGNADQAKQHYDKGVAWLKAHPQKEKHLADELEMLRREAQEVLKEPAAKNQKGAGKGG